MRYPVVVRTLLLVFTLALLAIGAVFVWPTMWRYDHFTTEGSTFPVRIHRFTGRTEMLLGPRGWIEVAEKKKAPERAPVSAESLSVPTGELAKLEGNLSITDYGWIDADIYNGTKRRLGEVHVRVVISNKDGTEAMNREYGISTADGEPLSSFRLKASCGCQLEKNQTFSWSITGAKWW